MTEVLQPSLRFPEFEGGWIETTFGSHYSFKATNSLSREKLNYKVGEVKNIHYGDIHTTFNLLFNVTKEPVPFINIDEDISNIDEENYIQNGDIVIADASEDYADVGKSIEVVNTNDERILAGLHTFLARKEDDEIAGGFFAFLLTTYKARLEIMRIAQGTKVLGLSKDRFSEIPLFIPQPEEQQKIANFLKAIDKRIQLLKDKKEALDDYKKSMMQKLFSQEIRFKQDDGSDFPEWASYKLGNIGKTLNGLTGKTKESFGTGLPYIQYMQIFKDSKINPNDFGLVNINLDENQTKIKYGDILFTTSSETRKEIGISSVLLEEIPQLYLNSFSFGYRLNSFDILLPEFAQFLFRSKSVRRRIIRLGQGSTRYNMSKVSFMEEVVLLPEKSEQIKIALLLSNIDRKIKGVSDKIEFTQFFKKSMLQKIFI